LTDSLCDGQIACLSLSEQFDLLSIEEVKKYFVDVKLEGGGQVKAKKIVSDN
jgi:hypothetical protein